MVRCRCGRFTFPVQGSASQRTCSECGYLVRLCRCRAENGFAPRLLEMSDRTRSMLGTAVLSVSGTLFVMILFVSPFLAVVGFGIPLALTASFFAQWLRESRAPEVAVPLALPREAARSRS